MDAREQPAVIPPTQLKPPGQAIDSAANRPRNHVWFWIMLGVLLLLALAVVFALPTLLGPAQQASAPAEPPSPEIDSGAPREQAHQALQNYLQLRARMELDNAAVWGEPDWTEAAGRASAGDRHFAQRQFAAAGREYQSALGQLQQLETNKSVMLASALEQGTRALDEDDVVAAIAGFEAALRIEPEHPDAVRGIAKANSRGAAITQMNLGRAAEANGDLGAARVAYQQAVQSDADYAKAQAALQRVSAEINAREFTAAMTTALNALDTGQTGAADKALAEAERLRPGDPAVRDARQRLQGMRARAGLNRLRRQAAERVGVEDWQGAVAAYRKALGIDGSAAFARAGLQRAEERVKLNRQFDHYLEKPARLYSAVPLANAEKLLASVSGAPREEPRLEKKITQLRRLVAGARAPVRVTLNSDGETSVVIYRVARLGKFNNHQLDLRPGDYTVVGSRPGYRDVRKVIKVRPGATLPPLLVRCEEAI